jgi:hypothetical protein
VPFLVQRPSSRNSEQSAPNWTAKDRHIKAYTLDDMSGYDHVSCTVAVPREIGKPVHVRCLSDPLGVAPLL